MSLGDELEQIADVAREHADDGEELAVVIPAEPADGTRVYLCAFSADDGSPELDRARRDRAARSRIGALVHDAVTIAALCELAEESAAGGDVDGLEARLTELAETEGVELVADAQAALGELRAILVPPPRVASPVYLDRIGLATRRFEQELGEVGSSPFAEAMKQGATAVEGLAAEVEGSYKVPLG